MKFHYNLSKLEEEKLKELNIEENLLDSFSFWSSLTNSHLRNILLQLEFPSFSKNVQKKDYSLILSYYFEDVDDKHSTFKNRMKEKIAPNHAEYDEISKIIKTERF